MCLFRRTSPRSRSCDLSVVGPTNHTLCRATILSNLRRHMAKEVTINLNLPPSRFMCTSRTILSLCISINKVLSHRQQPAQSSGGGGGGCMACLAGMCLCCALEGQFGRLSPAPFDLKYFWKQTCANACSEAQTWERVKHAWRCA